MAYGESNGNMTDLTSRDTERSNSWPQCLYSTIPRKHLEMLFSNNR